MKSGDDILCRVDDRYYLGVVMSINDKHFISPSAVEVKINDKIFYLKQSDIKVLTKDQVDCIMNTKNTIVELCRSLDKEYGRLFKEV